MAEASSYRTFNFADQSVIGIVSIKKFSFNLKIRDVEKVETQEFRTALERCLKRGVMVYIGYGYQKTKLVEGDVNATETAKETLDDLMGWYLKRKLEGRLEVYFYPTHSTALIKDEFLIARSAKLY